MLELREVYELNLHICRIHEVRFHKYILDEQISCLQFHEPIFLSKLYYDKSVKLFQRTY